MSRPTGSKPVTHFRRGWIYVLLLALVTSMVAGLHSYDWALWIAGILLVTGAIALGTMTRAVILPKAEAVSAA